MSGKCIGPELCLHSKFAGDNSQISPALPLTHSLFPTQDANDSVPNYFDR